MESARTFGGNPVRIVLALMLALAAFLLNEHASGADESSAAIPESERFSESRGDRPPASNRVGLSSHLIWYDESYIEQQMDRIQRGGVHWIRDDFLWNLLEPSPGKFDWQRTDRLMSAASRTETDVLAVVTFSPTWASSDPTGEGRREYAPEDVKDYAAFAAAVAARYGRRGEFWTLHPELAPQPLRAIELWNEPYGRWAWKPDPDPRKYVRLVKATSKAVRSVDGRIDLVLPADPIQARSTPEPVPWFERLLEISPGLLEAVDVLGVHPYPQPFSRSPEDNTNLPWSFGRVALTQDLAEVRESGLPVWITEVGWSTASTAEGGVSEATQASYVAAALDRSLNEWGSFVDRTFIYAWAPSTGADDDFEGNLPILREDGSAKPAWREIIRAARG